MQGNMVSAYCVLLNERQSDNFDVILHVRLFDIKSNFKNMFSLKILMISNIDGFFA